MDRNIVLIFRDIPFWWQFDFLLLGGERSLGKVMLDAMMDFSECNRYRCNVGGSQGSAPWNLFSSDSIGARTHLEAPIELIRTEIDSDFDARCLFFDTVIASKQGDTPSGSPPMFLAPEITPVSSNFMQLLFSSIIKYIL
jgi:hypothetical protein